MDRTEEPIITNSSAAQLGDDGRNFENVLEILSDLCLIRRVLFSLQENSPVSARKTSSEYFSRRAPQRRLERRRYTTPPRPKQFLLLCYQTWRIEKHWELRKSRAGKTDISLCRYFLQLCFNLKLPKQSCHNTCLLSYKSKVIHVSVLYFWLLHDFTNFDSNCSVDVILFWFHALNSIEFSFLKSIFPSHRALIKLVI